MLVDHTVTINAAPPDVFDTYVGRQPTTWMRNTAREGTEGFNQGWSDRVQAGLERPGMVAGEPAFGRLDSKYFAAILRTSSTADYRTMRGGVDGGGAHRRRVFPVVRLDARTGVQRTDERLFEMLPRTAIVD